MEGLRARLLPQEQLDWVLCEVVHGEMDAVARHGEQAVVRGRPLQRADGRAVVDNGRRRHQPGRVCRRPGPAQPHTARQLPHHPVVSQDTEEARHAHQGSGGPSSKMAGGGRTVRSKMATRPSLVPAATRALAASTDLPPPLTHQQKF